MDNRHEREEKQIDMLIAAIDKAYHKTSYLVWRSFLTGLASGLGATLGVALLLTLIGYLLRELGGVPFIGNWINNFNTSLPNLRN